MVPTPFVEHVFIAAPPGAVWACLTDPARMVAWMGEPDMMIEVDTSWQVGGPITVSGFHHADFVNTGTVRAFAPPHHLAYTHLSSLSGLPAGPENEAMLDFSLTPEGDGTRLGLSVGNCVTESIFKHLRFYWSGTLRVIKQHVERGSPFGPAGA